MVHLTTLSLKPSSFLKGLSFFMNTVFLPQHHLTSHLLLELSQLQLDCLYQFKNPNQGASYFVTSFWAFFPQKTLNLFVLFRLRLIPCQWTYFLLLQKNQVAWLFFCSQGYSWLNQQYYLTFKEFWRISNADDSKDL